MARRAQPITAAPGAAFEPQVRSVYLPGSYGWPGLNGAPWFHSAFHGDPPLPWIPLPFPYFGCVEAGLGCDGWTDMSSRGKYLGRRSQQCSAPACGTGGYTTNTHLPQPISQYILRPGEASVCYGTYIIRDCTPSSFSGTRRSCLYAIPSPILLTGGMMDIYRYFVPARPPSSYGPWTGSTSPVFFSCLGWWFPYCNWHGRTDGGLDHESNQPLNRWVARTSQATSRSCFPFSFPFPCPILISSSLPRRSFDDSPHRQPFSSAPHLRSRSYVSIPCVVPRLP